MKSSILLASLLLVAPLSAQDYRPISPACVVDGGEVRPGWTAKYVYEGVNYVVGFCCSACRTKFLQAPAGFMAAAVAAKAAPPPPKKEKKVAVDATGPCDLRKLLKVPYCVECIREIGKEDLRNGLCKRCEKKPVTIEYCVKFGETYYQADCHPEKKSDKPFVCDGKLFSIPHSDEDRARLSYLCESCMATADLEFQFKHAEGCKPKVGASLKKMCTKSGTAPHATEARKP